VERAGDVRRHAEPAPVRPEQLALDAGDLAAKSSVAREMARVSIIAPNSAFCRASLAPTGARERLRIRRTSQRCQAVSSAHSPRAEIW
jgi:hypothetical protein